MPYVPSRRLVMLVITFVVSTNRSVADDDPMPPRVLTGTVVDEAGKPIVDALIEWGHFRAPPDERESTRTNEQGEYRLESTLALQDYRLGVYVPGYAPRWHDGVIPGRDEPTTIDFVLPASTPFTGVVVGPAGSPLAGVSVEAQTGQIGDVFSSFSSPVSPTPFPGPERIAVTNENGEFAIDDLAASVQTASNGETTFIQVRTNMVQLTLRQDDDWLGQQEFAVDQPVRFEVSESYLPLTPETTGVVRGIVVDSTTFEPIEGFRVVRRHTTDGEVFASQNGRFELADPLRLGRQYEIRVFAEDYAPQSADALAVSADDDLEVTIGLSRHPSLQCRVVDALSGEPLPDVRVISGYYDPTQSWKYIEWSSFETYADGHHQLKDVQHVLTDAAGHAAFPEGSVPHTLVIFHPGYARTIVLPEERASLTNEEGVLRIELVPESRIAGRIVLDPIPGATYSVQVSPRSGLQEVEEMYHGEGDANDAGEFLIDRLRGGRYRLTVMLNIAQFGYPIWSTEVDVLDVESVDVELGAPVGPYTLSGTARPFAHISLGSDAAGSVNHFGGYADADGRYEITGLPEGSFRVSISLHSGVHGTNLDWHDSVEIAGDTQKDFALGQ